MVTSILKRLQPQRQHLQVLVVLLLMTFGMTLSFAWTALDASRRAKMQAEDTMRGWAGLAATGWKDRLEPVFVTALYYAFEPVLRAATSGTSISASELQDAVLLPAICECLTPDRTLYWFRYNVAQDSLEIVGAEPAPAVRLWLSSRLRTARAAMVAAETAGVGVAVGKANDKLHYVSFMTLMDENGRRQQVYGFAVQPSVIQEILLDNWRVAPLLPQAANAANDSLLYARVLDDSDIVVFESHVAYDTVYNAERRLSEPLAGLRIMMSARPDAADALIIGGIPEPPRGRLLALLGITALLLVSALLLIRREAELVRLRADFIAGVSHELRTPLAQIRMFAETLLLGRVRTDGERTRSLQIIDQEARRLAHLVENVLIFAKSERRKSRINPELTDLPADIREAVQGFAVLSRSREIEIRTELQPGIAAPLDRSALKQVLLNLLDNAVKYGPLQQRITVGLALFGGNARVWVDDEGPGVPVADREKVFGRFVRLSRDVESPVGGSGIGLAIVRELALLHGGHVWIEDAPGGRGARVVAEFPGAYVRPDVAAGGWAVA